ncbi:ATP-dependent Clp protease adapter ClpS [Camelimonas abortus]|uniref:ATP-dependent Clp protease adapter protein ClpS n=1 Tax=Camelimonas abortus TaxID=1017184 RepID=A0ABV7LF39_9HYPH
MKTRWEAGVGPVGSQGTSSGAGGSPRRSGEPAGPGVALLTRTRPKRPDMYKVLLLNDDFTPMEFVVEVLQRFFNKSPEDATRIMLHVHNHGVGVCGVYTFEVAETKVAQVMEFSRRHQHPLQCVMEKN